MVIDRAIVQKVLKLNYRLVTLRMFTKRIKISNSMVLLAYKFHNSCYPHAICQCQNPNIASIFFSTFSNTEIKNICKLVLLFQLAVLLTYFRFLKQVIYLILSVRKIYEIKQSQQNIKYCGLKYVNIANIYFTSFQTCL